MTVKDSYPRGVPISIKYPVMPVYEFWRNSARKFPDRDAVIYLGAKHAYRQLWEQTMSLAANLQGLGVEKGDRVGVLLPNCPHFIVAYNAVQALGATVVAINPLMPVPEIERELRVTGCKVLVILDRLLDKLPGRHPETLIVAEAAYYAPGPLRLLSRVKYRDLKPPKTALRFEDLITGPKLGEFSEIEPMEDVAVIMFTSGTTGEPKGVMLTHYNLVTNALQSYHWLRGWGYSAKPQNAGWPIILCALPFFHSFGLVTLNEAVSFGCTMVLLPNPTPLDIIKATDKHRVTHFPLIPRLIREILHHPDLGKHDLSSLTTCATGGAAIPVEHMKAFEEVSGVRMYQGYGLTEAGPSVCATPIEGDPNYASTGLLYPDTEAKIMDLQLGEIEMPVGVEGEIVVKGPQVMKGYWENPEATAEALRNGWLFTGDIGRMDENGYLYIVGRKRDRILARGHTIWPTIVEDTLMTHPKVEVAVAFGVPDPLRCSTDIRAGVKLMEGFSESEELERELIELCKEVLEEYQVPTRIMFRDDVPLTVMGKVDRNAVIAEIDAKIKELMQEGGEVPDEYK
ncbi:MAG: AMP-binding protein [Candidatus Bathyarchaeota archaeon]|nr:AMP-binding protein [Candidatus Bathyarchaeota archaeon]